MAKAVTKKTPEAITPVEQRFVEAAQAAQLDKLAPADQAAAITWYGEQTGLKPELGEVMIYQGRFYVPIAGRIRNAHRNHLWAGCTVRPATDGEFRNSGYEKGTILWRAEIHRRGAPHTFVEFGKVTPDEIRQARSGRGRDHLPLAKAPADLAKKRAKMNALRDAFPLGEEISIAHAEYIAEAEARILGVEAEEDPGPMNEGIINVAGLGSVAVHSDAVEAISEYPEESRGAPEAQPEYTGVAAMVHPWRNQKGRLLGSYTDENLTKLLVWCRETDPKKFADYLEAIPQILDARRINQEGEHSA